MAASTVTPVDTTAVVGNEGEAPTGTQWEADNVDTRSPLLAPREADYVSPPVTNTGQIGVYPAGTEEGGGSDTSGALGSDTTEPVSTAMLTYPDTLHPGQIGPGDIDPVYRAPSGLVQASTKDTSRTDIEAAGSVTNPVTVAYAMTDTPQTPDIGAVGSGTGATPPVAPTSVTVATGPRLVTVAWTAPADIADDDTLGFVILNSAGGTTYAPASATSVVVDRLSPDRTYTFQVAARNKAGIGPFSTASAAARPYNPDAPLDPLLPVGLAEVNTLNPIYNPDGTVKAGTGRNTAPVLGAMTLGTQDSYQVTVNWTAPTGGDTPTSYVILASDGTSTTSAAGTTSKVVTFADGGQTVTITVQALSDAGAGAVSAPSAPLRVPGGLNNAPVLGTITDGAPASKTITVTWAAPTLGQTPTGYVITASDELTTLTVGNVLTGDVVFADAGGVVTFTVHAVNAIGAGPESTASASHTVP